MGQPILWRDFGMVVAAAFLMLAAQLALKAGVGEVTIPLASITDIYAVAVRVVTTPLLILGYLFAAGNSLLWIAILSRMEVSVAAPLMTGVYFLMLIVASKVLLHEMVTPTRIIGTLAIAGGLWLVSSSS